MPFVAVVLNKPLDVRPQVGAAYRSEPCHPRPVERSQRLLTQTRRDAETAESFGRDRPGKPTRAGDGDVARPAETETSRRNGVLEVVARTGDRTRKGRHPTLAAFRVTPRYESFATVKTSGAIQMRTSDPKVMEERSHQKCVCHLESRGTSAIIAVL